MGRVRTTRSRRTLRGAAAVELALLIVPFMLMTMSAIEFARIVYTYNQLVKVTRDGARYLSGFDPTDGDYPRALARQRVVNPAGGTAEFAAPGLALPMVEVCDRVDASACPGEAFGNVATGVGAMNLVRVQIRGYRYQPVFPLTDVFGPIDFDTIGTTMRQVL
jgi:hypothetical protein